ncbi:MAG TPA: CHAD domain-containing protein [Acidobacteriaceae bacterium]|jgi:CHAD domain-containing protein|nr:CHAD domain-containing protein [Acidobacteriaceae bacterium]
MESIATNPVEMLRRQATCLEAAISVSLATPTRKVVHQLRSETRRIEAELDLLRSMHGIPPRQSSKVKLERRLRKLRRFAGWVRDCDIQRKLLQNSKSSLATLSDSEPALQEIVAQLRKGLRRRRRRAETKLLHLLEKHRTKLARDLEAVLTALKPREHMNLSPLEMLAPIERRFFRLLRSRKVDEGRLHDIRKAAKHARYQCEALPGPEAAAFAKQLERLQDAGGTWHDLLLLAEHSGKKLNASHPITNLLQQRRDEHLRRYLEVLDNFRNRHAARLPATRRNTHRSRPAAQDSVRVTSHRRAAGGV